MFGIAVDDLDLAYVRVCEQSRNDGWVKGFFDREKVDFPDGVNSHCIDQQWCEIF